MKQASNNTRSRGSQRLDADSRVPFQVTPAGAALVKKIKSHVDMVNEEIDLHEGANPQATKEHLYREYQKMLDYLPKIGLNDNSRYEWAIDKIRQIRAKILEIESI
jgi:hypothetical protein